MKYKLQLVSLFLIPLLSYFCLLVFALPKANLELLWFALISILGLAVGLALAVVFHEAGHGYFGHLVGYRLLSFKFLCFELYSDEEEKLHFRINPLTSLILGQCLMLPPKSKKHKLRNFQWYNAGGLIASYLWLVLMVAIFIFVNQYIRWFLMAMFLINLFLALNNTYYTPGGMNDRCNAKLIKDNPKYVDAINYQLAVFGNIYLGKRFGAKVNIKPYYEEKLNHVTLPVVEFLLYSAIDHDNFQEVLELGALLERNYHNFYFLLQRLLVNFDLMWIELVVNKNENSFRRRFRKIKEKGKAICLKPDTDINFYYRLYASIYEGNKDISSFINELEAAQCFNKGERLSLFKRMNYLKKALEGEKNEVL